MTQNQSNTSYALLAVALAASLLYRPVIAADPDAVAGAGRSSLARRRSPSRCGRISMRCSARSKPASRPGPAGPNGSGRGHDRGTAGRGPDPDRHPAAGGDRGARRARRGRSRARDAVARQPGRDRRAEGGAGRRRAPASAPRASLPADKGEAAGRRRGGGLPSRRTAPRPSEPADERRRPGPTELMLQRDPFRSRQRHADAGRRAQDPGGGGPDQGAGRAQRPGGRLYRHQGPAAYNMHLSLQRAQVDRRSAGERRRVGRDHRGRGPRRGRRAGADRRTRSRSRSIAAPAFLPWSTCRPIGRSRKLRRQSPQRRAKAKRARDQPALVLIAAIVFAGRRPPARGRTTQLAEVCDDALARTRPGPSPP